MTKGNTQHATSTELANPAQELRQTMQAEPNPASFGPPIDLDFLLDADVMGWKPEPGGKLIGRVLSIEEGGQGTQYGSYPLLLIRRDGDGELVNLHAFHTVLRTELGRRGVGVGDRIGIKYVGLEEGGDYGNYENYRVVVDRAGSTHLTTETVARRITTREAKA